MNKNTLAASVVLGGLAVAGLGAGAATLSYADPTPSGPPSAGATPAPGNPDPGQRRGPGRGAKGGLPGAQAKDLATKLGVDEARVTEALGAIHTEERAARQGQQPSTRPDPTARQAELAKKLAAKLGVDEAKVSAALNELRAAHDAQHQAEFKSRLDQAVTDGKLTHAEADAVQKAADAGVIGKGGRR